MLYVYTLGFMLLDIVTGVIMALKTKNLNSSKMREGLYKKAGNIVLIAVGIGIDLLQQQYTIGFNVPVASAICISLIVMEIISILENAGKINPQLMQIVKPYLEKLKKEEDITNVSH